LLLTLCLYVLQLIEAEQNRLKVVEVQEKYQTTLDENFQLASFVETAEKKRYVSFQPSRFCCLASSSRDSAVFNFFYLFDYFIALFSPTARRWRAA